MKAGQIVTKKKDGKFVNPDPQNGYLRLNTFFLHAEWWPFRGQRIETAPRVLLSEMN